ncbi:MAG: chemotaxis protein CheA [Hasllibacter sp.]
MTEDELRNGFLSEAEEILSDVQDRLDALTGTTPGDEDVAALFRGMHSLKGGAAAFSLSTLIALAHAGEEVLDRRRSDPAALTARERAQLQRCADLLAAQVAAERGEAPPSADAIEEVIAALGQAAPAAPPPPQGFEPVAIASPLGNAPPAPSAARCWRVGFSPARDIYRTANEPILFLRALAELGEVTVRCRTADLPLLDGLDTDECYLAWEVEIATEAPRKAIEEVFDFVESVSDIFLEEIGPPTGGECRPPDPVTPHVREAQAPATIRVDLDRVDLLMNQVGELVIAHSMLLQELGDAARSAHGRLGQQLSGLEMMIRDVQGSVMGIRAQPVKALFQRLARTVRETSADTGKPVALTTEGAATEIDKTLIERLAEPLTHLIRNAIDHGIEDPAGRRAAGKPAEGAIHLAARHAGGRVVIRVRDDGAGLDRDALRRRAEMAGQPLPPHAADEEVDALIFHPGLSTREAVTDLSGRGVGMSVVQEVVAANGGRITVASRPGQGTEFVIVLPLTLAVMDGLLVEAAGQTLVVPLDSVAETRTILPGEIHRAGPRSHVLRNRDSCVELIDLADALGFAPPAARQEERVALMIEGRAGERTAYLIDAVRDRRQIVIKALDGSVPAARGISGATILGDGGVALIVDPAILVQHAHPLEATA